MVATNDLKALLVPTRLRRGVDENEVQPFRTPEKRPESNRKALQKDQDPTYRRASVRTGEFCKRLLRLKISREFVRILIEHRNFVPQDPKHRIDIAERAALKLRELIAAQESECERQRRGRQQSANEKQISYEQQLTAVRGSFEGAMALPPQQKGYALEKIFTQLMLASKIPVEAPFSLKGEQIDGAIKYDSHYYIVELKWQAGKMEPKDIGAFYFKVEGRMGARGIAIAMAGYTDGVMETLPRGKELTVLLLDGNHLANVIYGHYTFQQLLEHAISNASLKGQLYCSHRIEQR